MLNQKGKEGKKMRKGKKSPELVEREGKEKRKEDERG